MASFLRLVATLTCIGAASAGSPAVAYDGQAWMRFGSQTTASIDQPYDHSFARQWEANPPKGFPTLAPDNLSAMKAAIQRYTDIVERGGWPAIPEGTLQPGASGRPVALLRQRLALSGDLRGGADEYFGNDIFDGTLERAVKRFQASNGLTPTGIVDKRTLAALNVPAAVRLKQLRTNLPRLQELSRQAGRK